MNGHCTELLFRTFFFFKKKVLIVRPWVAKSLLYFLSQCIMNVISQVELFHYHLRWRASVLIKVIIIIVII